MYNTAYYRVLRQTRERGFTNIVKDNYQPAKVSGRNDCHRVVLFIAGVIIQAVAFTWKDALALCEAACGVIVSEEQKMSGETLVIPKENISHG